MRRHPGRLPSGPEKVSAAPPAIESFLDLRDPPGRVQVDRLTPRAALEAEASRYRVLPRGPRQGHPGGPDRAGSRRSPRSFSTSQREASTSARSRRFSPRCAVSPPRTRPSSSYRPTCRKFGNLGPRARGAWRPRGRRDVRARGHREQDHVRGDPLISVAKNAETKCASRCNQDQPSRRWRPGANSSAGGEARRTLIRVTALSRERWRAFV